MFNSYAMLIFLACFGFYLVQTFMPHFPRCALQVNASVRVSRHKTPRCWNYLYIFGVFMFLQQDGIWQKSQTKKWRQGGDEERETEQKRGKSCERLRHSRFRLGGSLFATVYLVRAAIISAGRRRAAPVIDKRLHLYIVCISANILKQSIFTCPLSLIHI